MRQSASNSTRALLALLLAAFGSGGCLSDPERPRRDEDLPSPPSARSCEFGLDHTGIGAFVVSEFNVGTCAETDGTLFLDTCQQYDFSVEIPESCRDGWSGSAQTHYWTGPLGEGERWIWSQSGMSTLLGPSPGAVADGHTASVSVVNMGLFAPEQRGIWDVQWSYTLGMQEADADSSLHVQSSVKITMGVIDFGGETVGDSLFAEGETALQGRFVLPVPTGGTGLQLAVTGVSASSRDYDCAPCFGRSGGYYSIVLAVAYHRVSEAVVEDRGGFDPTTTPPVSLTDLIDEAPEWLSAFPAAPIPDTGSLVTLQR